ILRLWNAFDFLSPSICGANAITTLTLYREEYEYYRTSRGQHPNADRQVFTAGLAQLPFYPLAHMDCDFASPGSVDRRRKGCTRFYSRIAYDKAKDPRELLVFRDATHVEIYDKPQFVSPAVAKLWGSSKRICSTG